MSDALASLQKVLAPKAGMRAVPFPTESYVHASLPVSATRLLNWFAEDAPDGSPWPHVLMPSPGLVPIERVGTGPMELLEDYIGGLWMISGDHLYRHVGGVVEDFGFVGVPTPSGGGVAFPPSTLQLSATIAVSALAMMVCVPPRLYYALQGENALTEVDTTDFPGQLPGSDARGANSVTYIDGYFVVTQFGYGTTFSISGLNDPASWNALDFANVEGIETLLVRAIEHRGDLWLLGTTAAEIWYNTGAADFPFRRQSGGRVPVGFVPRSVAQLDGSLFWIEPRSNFVFRSNRYQPERVSSDAIEQILQVSDRTRAIGGSYEQDGHKFYVLRLPVEGRTLVYDVTTKKWHERSSGASGTGPWRPIAVGMAADFQGAVAGDDQGWLYALDPYVGTDNGVPIYRQAVLPPLRSGGHRTFCARAEIDMETGTTPPPGTISLDWSDDGGHSYTAARTLSGGTPGEYRKRVYTTRLGSFRERMFRITAAGRVTLFGLEADIAAPAAASGANS